MSQTRQPKLAARLAAILLRVGGFLVSLLLGAMIAAACVVLLPPRQLLGQALVVQLRERLQLPELDLRISELRLRRSGGLELVDLTIGAPAGYELPLLTARRLALRYDLSQLGQNKVRIEAVELIRPVVRVEQRNGKPNWQVLLERLEALGAPEEPGAPAEVEEPAAPTKLAIEVDRVAVEGLSVFIDEGERRLVLDALDFAASLRYGPDGGRARATVSFAPRADRATSLGFRLTRPEQVEALLDLGLRLDVELSRLQPLAARVKLKLNVRSRRISSRWDIAPLRIALALGARYDQREDFAQLDAFSLRFNDRELVQASAKLGQSQGPDSQLSLELDHLSLPLDLFAPYLRLVLPQLRCGGTVRLADLELQQAVSQLGVGIPRKLRGRVELDHVWAKLDGRESKGPSLGIDDLTGQLRFGANASSAERSRAPADLLALLPDDLDSPRDVASDVSPPAASASVRLRLGSARFPGGTVSGLVLDAVAAAETDGLDPTAGAVRARLRIARLAYRDPAMGTVRGALSLDASGHAAIAEGDATLERLRLVLNRRIRLDAGGTVRGWGERRLRGRLALAPVRLATLIAQLPRGVREQLPLRKVQGKLSFRATVAGRRPQPDTPPLRLPLTVESHLGVRDLGFDQLAPGGKGQVALRVRGAQVELDVRGRPADLRLKAELHAKRLAHVESGVALRHLALPLSLRLRRHALEGRFGLSVASLAQRQPGAALTQKDLALEGRVGLALPLERLLAGRVARLGKGSVSIEGRIGSVRLRQPDLRLAAEGLDAALTLAHEPDQKRPLSWKMKLEVAKLRERVMGAELVEIALALEGGLRGVTLQLPESALALDDAAGTASVAARLGKLRYPALLYRDLEGARLDVALELSPAGPLHLRQLDLRAPTYGLRLAGKARLLDPWRALNTAGLPAFEASLRVALDNPKVSSARRATVLTRRLRSAGKLGLTLSLAGLDDTRALAKGRLVAHGFYLWAEGRPLQVETTAGPSRWRKTLLELRNLNADVPLSQRLEVALRPFRLTIPPPKRSILQAATLGTIYELVRPFTRRRANLTLDGVTLTDQLLEGEGTSRHVVSKSDLALNKAVLDLAYSDSTLQLDQLYLELFGGDLLGRLKLQLPRLQPLNVRLATDLQLTDVDLAYLDAEARRRGESTPISALARLKYEMSRRYAAGRVLLTELSMQTLDKLLVYLDPHKIDESVQANRRLLSAWYTRAASPEVERVSVWMDHSQLNLDIRLGALWPFGAILRRALSNVKIRRLSIKPFLPSPSEEQDAKRPPPPTARRGLMR